MIYDPDARSLRPGENMPAPTPPGHEAGRPRHRTGPPIRTAPPEPDVPTSVPAPAPRGHTPACLARTDNLCECGAYMDLDVPGRP